MRPIALGWVDHEHSSAPDRDATQVQRLARRLGYALVWPDPLTLPPLPDQVRTLGAEAVILPAPDHLGPLELDGLMHVADMETVCPRLSFARWSFAGGSSLG
ncbi:hypothetical protein [Nocardia asiatica]|uniref:hypothetical protein n=1 Tax=Nocardia asiatica TaxID=209252 RepID=UPI0024576DC6|nr:hypothetical protein [Nocardia asiatica]